MWIPIVLIGGGLAFYFLTRPATPAPTAAPSVLPAQAQSLFTSIFGPSTPATAAKPATPGAPAGAPAAPAVASGGPYFQAYINNINQMNTAYNAQQMSQDQFVQTGMSTWSQAQTDANAGNISQQDLAQIHTALQQSGIPV
jgi:hypothetical protein